MLSYKHLYVYIYIYLFITHQKSQRAYTSTLPRCVLCVCVHVYPSILCDKYVYIYVYYIYIYIYLFKFIRICACKDTFV